MPQLSECMPGHITEEMSEHLPDVRPAHMSECATEQMSERVKTLSEQLSGWVGTHIRTNGIFDGRRNLRMDGSDVRTHIRTEVRP